MKQACGSSNPTGPLLVPQLVITEVSYLIETRLGWTAERRFLGDLSAGNFATATVLLTLRSAPDSNRFEVREYPTV